MTEDNGEQRKHLDLSREDLSEVEIGLTEQDQTGMMKWYVDVEEETVVTYCEDTGVAEENDRLGELFQQDPDRFIPVPSRHSSDDWQVMSNFISEKVEDPVVRDRLRDAIDGSGAFRRFKDVVTEEGLKDRWHAYRNREIRKAAIAWLEGYPLISEEKAEEFRASLEDPGSESEGAEETGGPEQMTEGGVVVCKRAGGQKGLSEGTEYEIQEERPGDQLIRIRDDRDNLRWYDKPLFEVVEPGRERDLDDLLMNIEVERKGDHFAHARILFDQGGYWTIQVATPEWVQQEFDPDGKGAHMGIRKVVIVPSFEELQVNRSLTALREENGLAPYALKRD